MSLHDGLQVVADVDDTFEMIGVSCSDLSVNQAQNSEVAAPWTEELHDILESILSQLIETSISLSVCSDRPILVAHN